MGQEELNRASRGKLRGAAASFMEQSMARGSLTEQWWGRASFTEQLRSWGNFTEHGMVGGASRSSGGSLAEESGATSIMEPPKAAEASHKGQPRPRDPNCT